MDYKVIYLIGLKSREENRNTFVEALSLAEQLYNSGIAYVCIKDECNAILVEFEK